MLDRISIQFNVTKFTKLIMMILLNAKVSGGHDNCMRDHNCTRCY